MKSFYLVLFFDTLFVAFSVFTVSLVLMRYFSASNAVLIVATALSFMFSVLFVKRKVKKNTSSLLSKKEKRDLDETLLTLNFMQNKDLFRTFETYFNKTDVKPERKKDCFYLPDKNQIVYLSCGIDGAQKVDVVRAFNHAPKDGTGVIFCTTADKSVLDFCKRFNGKIKIVVGEELYKMLKSTDSLPEKNVTISPPQKDSGVFKTLFSRKKARNYFLLGTAFLLMSFFVSIKLYYVLFGTLFTLFSVTCRFFAPERENQE